MGILDRYRATGADLPFGDPRRAHPGVAMEGYFWRITDQARGRPLITLIGVNQGPDGPWTRPHRIPPAFPAPRTTCASTSDPTRAST
ncbi:hypothetical protein [Ornithinimicrobium panacihumi]|uniref:hypothetical protein n=1 Tax=Ornithinimicrobium panacihumi TaxID=2008449 RepID=UPI003F88EE61